MLSSWKFMALSSDASRRCGALLGLPLLLPSRLVGFSKPSPQYPNLVIDLHRPPIPAFLPHQRNTHSRVDATLPEKDAELRQRPAGAVGSDVRAARAGDVQRAQPVVGSCVVAQGAAAPARLAPRLRASPAGGGGDFVSPCQPPPPPPSSPACFVVEARLASFMNVGFLYMWRT